MVTSKLIIHHVFNAERRADILVSYSGAQGHNETENFNINSFKIKKNISSFWLCICIYAYLMEKIIVYYSIILVPVLRRELLT